MGGRRDLQRQQHHRARRATGSRSRSTPVRRRSPTRTAPGPSNRRQPFDATFGLQATDPVTLHKEVVVGKGKSQTITSVGATAPGGQQYATFSDADEDAYFHATNPLGGVLVAGHGVSVTVKTQNEGGTMTVNVVNPGL